MSSEADPPCIRTVVLIGMPGVGKSTVGKRMARLECRPFFDTDRVLEAREGMPVRNVLDTFGIDGFNEREEAAILSLDVPPGSIVSTGGSVVFSEAAMRHLRSLGTVVYLKADLRSLLRRTGDLKRRGVVAPPGTTLETILQERAPLYVKYADVVFETSNAPPDVLARLILERMCKPNG